MRNLLGIDYFNFLLKNNARVNDGSKVPRTANSMTAAERSGAGGTP